MGWSTSVITPPDGDMADYMASLQLLHDREDRVYYPAHGPQVDKPRQLVRGMIGHRRQRESQIRRLLEAGHDSIEALVPQMYKSVDQGLWPLGPRASHRHGTPRSRRAPGRKLAAHTGKLTADAQSDIFPPVSRFGEIAP